MINELDNILMAEMKKYNKKIKKPEDLESINEKYINTKDFINQIVYMVEKVLRNIKNGYPRTFKLKHDDNILFRELVGIKRQARAPKEEAINH